MNDQLPTKGGLAGGGGLKAPFLWASSALVREPSSSQFSIRKRPPEYSSVYKYEKRRKGWSASTNGGGPEHHTALEGVGVGGFYLKPKLHPIASLWIGGFPPPPCCVTVSLPPQANLPARIHERVREPVSGSAETVKKVLHACFSMRPIVLCGVSSRGGETERTPKRLYCRGIRDGGWGSAGEGVDSSRLRQFKREMTTRGQSPPEAQPRNVWINVPIAKRDSTWQFVRTFRNCPAEQPELGVSEPYSPYWCCEPLWTLKQFLNDPPVASRTSVGDKCDICVMAERKVPLVEIGKKRVGKFGKNEIGRSREAPESLISVVPELVNE
ncbi:hypothetical protein BC826DRAFT_970357 [Russula brevipes]|nr:hypothetical protein BC826DRAFT_970357 [Russula brevipes]